VSCSSKPAIAGTHLNSPHIAGWFAIRKAWPQHNIPHPDHLAQKNQRVITPAEMRSDSSLAACNASRNLLL
jgi:hypothetical protein